MMSTGVCGPDGIPILKRLTAMEPDLIIPTPPKTTPESPTLELSESDEEGYDADEEIVEKESDDDVDDGSLQNLLPLLPVIAVAIVAWLWGVAYSLSPTRSVYPPAY